MSKVWMVPVSSEWSSTLQGLLEQVSQNHWVPEASKRNSVTAQQVNLFLTVWLSLITC